MTANTSAWLPAIDMHIATGRLDTRMFSNHVARRTFLLFIACALVPVCALALLAFQQVTSQLQEQAHRRLHQGSKQIAMALLNRLLAAEAELGPTARALAERSDRRPLPLTAAMWTAADGTDHVVIGEMNRPTLTTAQLASIAAGKTVLSTARDGSGRVRVIVSRGVDPVPPHRAIAHGLVNPTYLWALDDELIMAGETKVVVLDEAGRVLFTSFNSGEPVPEAVTRQAGQRLAGHFQWQDDRGTYLATHWALFLQSSMGVPKWTVVLSQPQDQVLAPVAAFTRIFLLVLALTILTVVLVSGQQIRRSLTPLAQLKEGARRLALGDLETRVAVTSRDEFADVARGFNEMASQLGRQFHTLALRREITAAFNPTQPLEDFLQLSADAVVRHLDLPLVCIWLVGDDPATFPLRASARMAGVADQPPPRLPLTDRELDRVRCEQQAFVTNALLEDARRGDLTWAGGFTAFVAQPVAVEDRLLGIAGAFATHALEATELSAFGSAVGDIARGIDRKRVDDALRDSESQTRQLQKMEAVGRLAGGIAHDFNNLLTVITGRTYLLLHDLAADDPRRKGILTIDATAQRAAQLTRQLLAFSRKQILAPTVLDLNEVVEGLTDMLHRLIGESIELTVTPGADLAKAKLDKGQVEQVLVNLVVNARDAMPQGGRIVVSTLNVQLDEAFIRQDGAGSPGLHAMIAVTDTGTGMDAVTRARIFEPFFTTKEVGKGTGLGLATVLGIIQQSAGHIRVESEVGVGTTFRMYFPCVDEAAAPSDTVLAPPRGGSETVLVVDDEVEVQALLQTALIQYGYTVLGATSPSEAIRLAQHHAGPIHLLLADMVMPEMSGALLAQRLTIVRPDMATVYMSGYADYTAEAIRDNRTRFLQKPFAPDTVLRTIRDVLDTLDAVAADTKASRLQSRGMRYGQSPTAQFT
jgi:signal transduction histidine kinase/ActR/RegA family two-component response regulator